MAFSQEEILEEFVEASMAGRPERLDAAAYRFTDRVRALTIEDRIHSTERRRLWRLRKMRTDLEFKEKIQQYRRAQSKRLRAEGKLVERDRRAWANIKADPDRLQRRRELNRKHQQARRAKLKR